MYTLTLTLAERKAFDFVGYCYANGHRMYALLWAHCEQTPNDADWDDGRDITFTVPEWVAWSIAELAEEDDNLWPLFAPELTAKMQDFCAAIV